MLDQRWVLADQVSVRPERFGALAYHFGTRRLSFLKDPELARLVAALGDSDTVRDALTAAQIPPPRWDTYLAALADLAGTDMIRQRAEAAG